jgi:hypothetical protein
LLQLVRRKLDREVLKVLPTGARRQLGKQQVP